MKEIRTLKCNRNRWIQPDLIFCFKLWVHTLVIQIRSQENANHRQNLSIEMWHLCIRIQSILAFGASTMAKQDSFRMQCPEFADVELASLCLWQHPQKFSECIFLFFSILCSFNYNFNCPIYPYSMTFKKKNLLIICYWEKDLQIHL